MNKRVIGMLLSISILLLAGCQNFTRSKEIAEQIQAAIDYANSDAYLIKVQPQKGTGNVVKPAGGEAYKKATDVFEIAFETSSEYEFVYWTISSKSVPQGKTIWDYIIIDDPNKAETTVRFENPLDDIIITPVVSRRPKLLSYSPANLDTLSLKDSKIKVIFDRQMDPSSIYYDWEEIVELENEYGLQEDDFLRYTQIINKASVTHYYGYKINTGNGEEYIYKNILIKNNESQKNINNRFEAPYFESPTILIIPPNRSLLPEAYSYVSVSLDKGFCYKIEYETVPSNQYIFDPRLRNFEPVAMSKQIGMFESKDWVYQVNNSQDSTPPSLKKCTMKYKDSNEELNDLTTFVADHTFDTAKDCAQTIYTFTPQKDNKIYIELEAFDDGSGPTSYFDIVMYRFYDRQYNYISPNNITTIRTDYAATGTTSTYKGELDISNYPEGVYTLNFIIYDNNGFSSIWPKTGTNNETNVNGYFIIDKGVYLNEPVIEDSSATLSNLKVSWTPPVDFSKVSLRYKKTTETDWSTPLEITDINTTSYEFTSLDYATDYNFEITFEDICGNSKTFNLTDYTKPCTPTITSFTYINNSQVILSYSFNSQPSGTEYVYLACSTDKNFNPFIKRNLPSNTTSYNFSYGELKNYTYYEIRVEYKNKYTRSQKWKRTAPLGINPTFTPDE